MRVLIVGSSVGRFQVQTLAFHPLPPGCLLLYVGAFALNYEAISDVVHISDINNGDAVVFVATVEGHIER